MTDESRVGVPDSPLRTLGPGVLLARLVAGVPVLAPEGEPLAFPSTFRLLGGGLAAVPFLGAGRFFDGAGFGFAGILDESEGLGSGEALVTVLSGVPGDATRWELLVDAKSV